MQRYLCVHGHFYQPPRENPWIESIEIQDSAHPYHDWNERVAAECYAPNTASRILDEKGRIREIVNNYARISFNVGPTLMSWLEVNAPDTYAAIIEADRASVHLRGGHGNAMAQAYNHMIMPLASRRDKATQCAWGIRDFQHRFGRDPEGLWLPETAADMETLEALASFGITFTVLAPHQAARHRRIGSNDWRDTNGGKIDPAKPYICQLPSGKSITIFFYDGPVSRAVAFEGILKSGVDFANRLVQGFSDRRQYSQLMHIATDGESYGHHHKFGEMALSFALDHIEQKKLARVTNYAEYLSLHPPTEEVMISERTSWSCSHGIERWRSDCGCNSGGKPKWRQHWRSPLRQALDQLRDSLEPAWSSASRGLFKDPEAARDAFINVVMDRSEESVKEYLDAHAARPLNDTERVRALGLMELQRNAMLMYTSCGWFFDDLAGIETVQVLMYAARVIQLGEALLGLNLELPFLEQAVKARSNDLFRGTGADIYTKEVKPRVVSLNTVVAHYAISSLFTDYALRPMVPIHCYEAERKSYARHTSGKTVLVTGRCAVSSRITGESGEFSFGVLHLGDHDFTCGVLTDGVASAHDALAQELRTTFERGAFADLVRLFDSCFHGARYTLSALFRDEQRRILDIIVRGTHESFESDFKRIYEDNRILMLFLRETGIPVHRAFLTAAEFTLNEALKDALCQGDSAERVHQLIEEFKRWTLAPMAEDLEYTFRLTLESRMRALVSDPYDTRALEDMLRLMDIALSLPFSLNLWVMQNLYSHLALTVCRKALIDPAKAEWAMRFRTLGNKLNFNLDRLLAGCV